MFRFIGAVLVLTFWPAVRNDDRKVIQFCDDDTEVDSVMHVSVLPGIV